MKRFATLFASGLVAFVLAGCEAGIPEGAGKEEGPATGQPAGFREMMEAQGKNMKMQGKGRPAGVPKAKPAPAEDAPKEPAK